MKSRVLVLSIAPALLLMFWVLRDLAVNGDVEFSKSSEVMTSDISQYYPEGRLGEVENSDNLIWQPVQSEPIYFDVRLPRLLNNISINILAKGELENVKVGIRRNGENNEWNYELKEPNIINKDGETYLTQTFDLSNATVDSGKVRFIISAPNVSKLELSNIQVSISGNKFTWNYALNAIKQRLSL